MAIADQSKWRFVLTDLLGSTDHKGAGMVTNSTGKQFSHHLNSGRTAQFTINIDNPAADFVLNPPEGYGTLLKVYRKQRVSGNWQLLMVGDVIHAEEGGQGDVGLLTVVATDPWWRLQRRLVGIDWASYYLGSAQVSPFELGSETNRIDYSALVWWIMFALNELWPTGLDTNLISNTGNTSFIGPTYAQNAGDLIQQMCTVLGGPEVDLAPVEPEVRFLPYTSPFVGGVYYAHIGNINIYKALGSSKPNTVFEYGTGSHNVASYDRILSQDGLCNVAFSPPQGFPDSVMAGDGVISSTQLTNVTQQGLYMDLVQGDLASQALRSELCQEYITVRGQTRQQITFTPTVDCPLDYTVDYTVGDVVQARAWVSGGYRLNGSVRIYGVDFSVDDNDAETPALTLIPG